MCSGEQQEKAASNARPSHAVAAETEWAADSGEEGEHGARSANGDEREDDDASAVSWASVEDTVTGESYLEGGEVRPGASAAARNTWWDKKGDDAPRGRKVPPLTDKHPSSSTEQDKSEKAPGGEDAPKHKETPGSSRQQPPPEPAQQHGGASQQRSWEEAQHGVQHGEARGKPNREEKLVADALAAQEAAATPSSDELEPGELVHAPTSPDSPNYTQQQTPPMPAGVGRGWHSRSRVSEAAHGGIRSQPRRLSSLCADTQSDGKRPQRSTKKARRDVAGRLRGRTSGSEHEEASAKQRASKQPATHDVNTDSDFFFFNFHRVIQAPDTAL
ncbi:hypothetical protein HPB52_022538 [Rhipicephalus sanguineus]|uniref:Uncharacterized protein n=1 Tax=Rhipicephalus sanguineus TaxID=34632 RepID=A0A9D4SXX2_RHISA|nr:hypothetical protein HPB52_022538 [Rhipicephalus sanguineus]